MNEQNTQSTEIITGTAGLTRKTVEEAIEFILEEGRTQGYQQAMKVYGAQYKDVIRKGRKQGFLLTVILAAISYVVYHIIKKNVDEKKEEAAKEEARKAPIDVSEYIDSSWDKEEDEEDKDGTE